MGRDRLEGVDDQYDVIVVGAGLAGMTAANCLAKCGRSVLLLEQHYNFGGMATWFRRKGGHIFDISLHGFPIGETRWPSPPTCSPLELFNAILAT